MMYTLLSRNPHIQWVLVFTFLTYMLIITNAQLEDIPSGKLNKRKVWQKFEELYIYRISYVGNILHLL